MSCGPDTTCELPEFGLDPGSCAPIGDPAMIRMTPAEELGTAGILRVPDGYSGHLAVLRTAGTIVTLDEIPLSAADSTPLAYGIELVRVPLEAGTHQLAGQAPFQAYVYGFSAFAGVGYPVPTWTP